MKSLKMEIEKTDEWDKVGNYLNTQIVFECGKTVLNDSLLEELCDIIADIFEDAGDGVYKLKYGKNTILIEDGEILDEFIKEEILEAAERLFRRQIIEDICVYGKYYNLYRDYLIEINHDNRYNESYISRAAEYFEQMLEECSVEELLSLSDEELEEKILSDIEDD